MDTLRKYPRTVHLPFSSSFTSDDLQAKSEEAARLQWPFLFAPGAEMVITEKMDGENTTLYREHIHARSLDSRDHPSRSFVKGLWGGLRWRLPEGRRIICENVYAEHSISYKKLPAYVLAFAVVDELSSSGCLTPGGKPTFLSWDATVEVFQEVGLPSVPVLYRGPASFAQAKEIFQSLDYSKQEGIVVRDASAFPEEDFSHFVGKAVRPGHVTTTTAHWTSKWQPNGLAS